MTDGDWLTPEQKAAADAYIAEHPHGSNIDPDAIQRAASRARVVLRRQISELQKQREAISKSIIEHTRKAEEFTDQLWQTDQYIADYRLAIEKLETK